LLAKVEREAKGGGQNGYTLGSEAKATDANAAAAVKARAAADTAVGVSLLGAFGEPGEGSSNLGQDGLKMEKEGRKIRSHF
jgi:hypothetical protein